MIKPFSDAKNLKIATALYQLTIHSEDAYTTVAQISDKSGVSPEQVQDCLESDLSQFILEKEGPESQFRFEGMYMNSTWQRYSRCKSVASRCYGAEI